MGIHRQKAKSLFTFFIFMFSISIFASEEDYCKEYLNWQMSHAKETLLQESIKRVHKKLELAFLSAYGSSKGIRFKNNDEFIRLSDALKHIDQDFSNFLDKHFQYRYFKSFYKKRYIPEKELSIHELVYRWKKFQEDHPEHFEELSSSELLDEWDLFAADSIEQLSTLSFDVKPEYKKIIKDFSKPQDLISFSSDFEKKFSSAKNDFHQNEKKLEENFKAVITDSLTNFENTCPKEILLEEGELACLEKQSSSEVYLKKSFMSDLIGVFEKVEMGGNKPEKPLKVVENTEAVEEPTPDPVPEDPLEDIVIEEPQYKTNDGIATFCKRDPNVADTIAIHHTATGYHETAESLNNMHLQRKTGNEHWYMLGYNFLIKQDDYSANNVRLIQGRPIDMAGSHAGGAIKPSAETLKVINKEDVICGNYKYGFSTSKLSSKIKGGHINANYTTIGISVIGNYAPKHYVRRGGVVIVENETGYEPKGPKRYPSDNLLKQTAKLACSLQKKYPRLKHIKPHQFFKATECPGTVKERLNKIIQYAKEFSCDFLP